jgi:cysteine desulfurase/selenocysteine lyase
MIREVGLRESTWADPPARFEAGTPSVADAVGFGAACAFLSDLGMQQVAAHEQAMTTLLWERLSEEPGIELYGPMPEHRSGLVTFNITDIHAHDVASLLDERHVCVRAGHHCTQPLHGHLGLTASARASVGVYTAPADIEHLINGLRNVRRILGSA